MSLLEVANIIGLRGRFCLGSVLVPRTLETSVTTDPGNSSSFASFLDVNMVIYKVVRSRVVATPPVRPPLRPCPQLSSQPRSRPPSQALTSQCCGESWERGGPLGTCHGREELCDGTHAVLGSSLRPSERPQRGELPPPRCPFRSGGLRVGSRPRQWSLDRKPPLVSLSRPYRLSYDILAQCPTL